MHCQDGSIKSEVALYLMAKARRHILVTIALLDETVHTVNTEAEMELENKCRFVHACNLSLRQTNDMH